MKCLMMPTWQKVLMLVLVAYFGVVASGAYAQSEINLNGTGELHFVTRGRSSLTLRGTASLLGSYTGSSEIAFVPGDKEGELNGHGVAVFQAANGDRLVGAVTWYMEADGTGHLAFSWRDAVEWSDGTLVHSTGRFARARPHQTTTTTHTVRVVAGIIGILIG